MPLAPQVYNPGRAGQNARYDIRGLQRGERGFTDGVYWYDENGLSLDRPDSIVEGLRGADNMNGDMWGDYLGDRRPQATPPEGPQFSLAGDIQQVPPTPDPNRVPDAQNPGAIRYALQRLAQLRALGYEFDIIDGDPAATWRNASIGVAEAARAAGYDNPRDWLSGRPKPGPRPPVGFYDEGDTVAPSAHTPRRGSRPSAAKTASKIVRRPSAKSSAAGAKKIVKRPKITAEDIKRAASKPRTPYRPVARPKTNIRKAAAKAQPFRRG